MQNKEQTLLFPAFAVMSKNISKEVKEKSIEVSKLEGIEKEQAIAELVSSLTEHERAELSKLGVKLPTDSVPLTLQLGTLLWDVYGSAVKEPSSPLGKAAHRKRVSELAEVLQHEEFEIPDFAYGVIRDALNTDSVWDSLVVTVSVPDASDKDLKNYLQINSNGANFFSDVLNAAAEAVMEERGNDKR